MLNVAVFVIFLALSGAAAFQIFVNCRVIAQGGLPSAVQDIRAFGLIVCTLIAYLAFLAVVS